MSDLILPPGLALPAHMLEGVPMSVDDTPEIPTVEPQEKPDEELTLAERGRYLPEPVGYKLLCALPEVEKTFGESGIVRPDAYIRQEEHATVVLFVLAMGPEAYKDEKKFPNGPWCKKGDFIVVRTYAGTRFNVFGKEMRVINDDMVECVVSDPRGIQRVGA